MADQRVWRTHQLLEEDVCELAKLSHGLAAVELRQKGIQSLLGNFGSLAVLVYNGRTAKIRGRRILFTGRHP